MRKKERGADQKESSPGERDSQAPEGGLGIMPGKLPPQPIFLPIVPISCLPYCAL